MYRAIVAPALLGVVLIAGCSKSPTAAVPGSFVVSPVSGATGVRLDAAITLTFPAPVDRNVVERDLHLISQSAMNVSTCPDSTSMSHGTMADWMADSSKMNHMDRYHATVGHFSWNDSGTACTFKPDSMMTPATPYMIHLGRRMMEMVTQRMDSGITMSDHGSGMMSGDMMLHFTTLDAGGHLGHH